MADGRRGHRRRLAEATTLIPGMGTHHIRGGITPAMLDDPSFDKANPILDDAGLDDQFVPTSPRCSSSTATARPPSWSASTTTSAPTTGQPPAGFEGNNDWWHIHPKICFRKTDAAMIGFNTSDSSCTSQNGINVNMANYYMLHVWVLDDMKFIPDVYAGMIPCITGGTHPRPERPVPPLPRRDGRHDHDMTPEEHAAME